MLTEVVHINGVESVAETAIRALSERSKLGRKTPTKTSTLIITGVKRVSLFILQKISPAFYHLLSHDFTPAILGSH